MRCYSDPTLERGIPPPYRPRQDITTESPPSYQAPHTFYQAPAQTPGAPQNQFYQPQPSAPQGQFNSAPNQFPAQQPVPIPSQPSPPQFNHQNQQFNNPQILQFNNQNPQNPQFNQNPQTFAPAQNQQFQQQPQAFPQQNGQFGYNDSQNAFPAQNQFPSSQFQQNQQSFDSPQQFQNQQNFQPTTQFPGPHIPPQHNQFPLQPQQNQFPAQSPFPSQPNQFPIPSQPQFQLPPSTQFGTPPTSQFQTPPSQPPSSPFPIQAQQSPASSRPQTPSNNLQPPSSPVLRRPSLSREPSYAGTPPSNLSPIVEASLPAFAQPPIPGRNHSKNQVPPTANVLSAMSTVIPTKKIVNLQNFDSKDIQRDHPPLAKGSFGVVYTGKVPRFPKKVVVKDMDIYDQSSIAEWKKELTLMTETASEYVAEVYGYSYTGSNLTIVMEYFPRGDLFNLLHKSNHPLSTLQRMRLARHVTLGIAHIHKMGIVHRDIKSMNILITEDYSAKLTDFGTAKLVESKAMLMTCNQGTPVWMAPEVKIGQYGSPADIFSLGLVFFELFSGNLAPYWNARTQSLTLPATYKGQSVVQPCIAVSPSQRPTAVQVTQFLDHLINKTVLVVKNQMSPIEQEQLKQAVLILQSKSPSVDLVEQEISVLYQYLLKKPPNEVDQMIDAAFASK